MYKTLIEQDLKKALEELGFKTTDIVLSIPENSEFGDYSTNIPLQLANQKSQKSYHSPKDIASDILEKFDHPIYLERIEVAGAGFINFFLSDKARGEDLKEILNQGEKFGSTDFGKGQKIQVEFISANPTGPLTLGNGRGGSIGDSLAKVLEFSGYQVDREYYINDTGNQVRILGESVLAVLGKIEPGEQHYQAEYVKELAEKFKDDIKPDPLELGHKVADYLFEYEIKPAIQRMGIKFDEYFSERSLQDKNGINQALTDLKNKNLAYEKDGAWWFKATQFGDDKDRVILTSESERGRAEPTYFLSDIAHHIEVLDRGYLKRINILGADHHSYASRITAVMEALGYKNKVDIILMQLVKLYQGGKEVRMSKRAGNFATLDELLDQVDPDVARFFFLMYSPNSHINFDLDLAREKSQKNPVYYVQYAHARMAGILGKMENGKWKMENGKNDLSVLVEAAEKELIKHLLKFPDLVEEISKNYQVHKLTEYSIKLADSFHKFYEACPVITAPTKIKPARVDLVRASKIVLMNSLSLLGVSAPERM